MHTTARVATLASMPTTSRRVLGEYSSMHIMHTLEYSLRARSMHTAVYA